MTPLGSNESRPVDVRFIATSRTDLQAEVTAGRFRADLFYRLAVVNLTVPPLESRRQDIPLLFARLLAEAAGRQRVDPVTPSPALVEALVTRDWPGNVRELRNAAERCALGLGIDSTGRSAENPSSGATRLAERVAEFERAEIVRALIAHGGALKPVYEALGLSRKTLYEKMQKLGIDKTLYSEG